MKSSRKINFLCFLRKRKKTTANCTAKFCLTKLRDDNFPGMADDPASLENCRFHPRNPQFCCAIGGVIFLFCISKFCIRTSQSYLPEVVNQCLKQITEKKSFKFTFFSVEIHKGWLAIAKLKPLSVFIPLF